MFCGLKSFGVISASGIALGVENSKSRNLAGFSTAGQKALGAKPAKCDSGRVGRPGSNDFYGLREDWPWRGHASAGYGCYGNCRNDS